MDRWQAAGQSRADLDARDQLLIVSAKVGSNIYSLRSRFTFKGNRTKSSAPKYVVRKYVLRVADTEILCNGVVTSTYLGVVRCESFE